ncbi:response regulator [Halopiger goleimassiliensis]|uniref:response regulator n=1 Tax=Halopiger goleimassiliensis TaxID=1293048 RepID=UPI000677A8E7|nr:response regulator [Halopiger goleimassiliensis]
MPSQTVLLVEDSDFLTAHVSETLRSEHGFDIETAESAAETRSVLEDGGIDCVVTNYELPDETGIDLAASLAEIGGASDVPVVLFTGNSIESLAEEALEAGVSAFVSKSSRASGDMNVFANRIRLAIQANE